VSRPLQGAALAVGIAMATVSACSGSSPTAHDQPSTSPTSSSQASDSPTPSPQQLAVERAYEGFWKMLPRASEAKTDAARVGLLVPVTTDPELSQLISSMHRQSQRHRVLYGQHIAHIESISITGPRAQVHDCQDASAAGIATTSGKKLTVGVRRNPVVATLIRRGGTWKVSTIAYPKGTTC
jgi:hypothetical protein